MKLFTVIGARPQFIKAAVVSHELLKHSNFEEHIVHTGQHYDYNMSKAFFEELSIPLPKENLGISGGSHAQMTGSMMVALEDSMQRIQPDAVLLYGDTNSTLAAALAAAKLHIPITHVEAGARTGSKTNPEEINRICTDHVSSLLLACTEESLANLGNEGLSAQSFFIGDPMLDAFFEYSMYAVTPELVDVSTKHKIEVPGRFYYLTCHREENTDFSTLQSILDAMDMLDYPVIYPVHPRNRANVMAILGDKDYSNIVFADPLGYLESLYLVNNAEQVITDSGGLQREAFFAGVKCTTLLDFEVWPETMVEGRNILAQPGQESILHAMQIPQHIDPAYNPFGDGHAASKIVARIESAFNSY